MAETATPILGLPHHAEWWVVPTSEGLKALSYRANARAGAVGPFMSRDMAELKIQELEDAADRRRGYITIVVCAVLMVLLTVLLKVLP